MVDASPIGGNFRFSFQSKGRAFSFLCLQTLFSLSDLAKKAGITAASASTRENFLPRNPNNLRCCCTISRGRRVRSLKEKESLLASRFWVAPVRSGSWLTKEILLPLLSTLRLNVTLVKVGFRFWDQISMISFYIVPWLDMKL